MTMPAEDEDMIDEQTHTCEHVNVALMMQQMIRERDTAGGGAPATEEIGEVCGAPAVGSVEIEGVRHYFCAAHVIEEPIVRS